jgi:hypothetical protein
MSKRCVALFTGSREWADETPIYEDIVSLPDGAVVIHGGALGADMIADHYARANGYHVAEVKALWSRHGKAAGPLRNDALMALMPTVAYAYPLPQSRGTWDMVRKLEAANVPVFVREAVPRP